MSAALKLVVADDEMLMRHLLSQSLGGQGFEILMAETGQQAFELVKRNKVDLVLSDISMPEGTGLQLLGWMRNSEFKNIPVVLMTGDQDNVAPAEAAGATLLRKPFRRRELVELINSVLKRT